MTKWFTADLHLRHNNILKYCAATRPFASIDEMNRTIITNWNAMVLPDDDIYVLGDFGFGNVDQLQRLFDQLLGHKHLIVGNHDKSTVGIKGWESMTDYHGAKVVHVPYDGSNLMVVLSHFAYAVWDKSHHGSINLYGHSHGSPPDTLRPNNQQCDVGVDAWNCFPCNINMVMDRLKTLRPFRTTDHHQQYRD